MLIALLSHGAQPASSIARHSGISRTHVYDIAESLLEKGIVTSAEIKGVKRYESLDHAGLMAHISNRQQRLRKLEKEFAESASAFHSLRSGLAPSTKIRFFEGQEGMKSVFSEVHRDLTAEIRDKKQPTIVTFFAVDKLAEAFPAWHEEQLYVNFPNFVKKDIIVDGPLAREYIENYREGPTTHLYKFWPKDRGDLPIDAVSWGNKVEITDVATREHLSGIVIDNSSFSRFFRMWFDALWDSLPEV